MGVFSSVLDDRITFSFMLSHLFSDQGYPEVVGWLDKVEPLLYWTPLLSIMPRTHRLVKNMAAASTKSWNTQQVSHSPNLHHQNHANFVAKYLFLY